MQFLTAILILKIFTKKNNLQKNKLSINLAFTKVDKSIFPIIKLKDRINELPSTPIIINAANEVLVAHFLKRKMPFLNIYKHIFDIMNDSNYRKYAVKKPVNLKQILNIDNWAKSKIKKKI